MTLHAKKIFFLTIFAAIICTFLFLNRNFSVFISLTVLSTVLFSVLYLTIYNDYTLLFASLLIANHFLGQQGHVIARYTILATVIFVIPLIFYLKKPPNITPTIVSICCFVVYYSAVMILRPYSISTNWFLVHLESLLLFIICQFLNWDLFKIKKVLFIHLAILLLYSIPELILYSKDRIEGPMLSATAYGVIITLIWATWFSMEMFNCKPSKTRLIAVTVATLFVITATGTRMGYVGVFITAVSLLLIRTYLLNKNVFIRILKIAASFLIFLSVMTFVWVVLPDDLVIKQNFSGMLQGEIDASNLGRLFVWYTGLQAFLHNPVLGVGSGNFFDFITVFYGTSNIYRFVHAHNVSIILLSELGLIGFLSFFLIISMAVFSLIKYLRTPGRSEEGFGLLIGFIVMVCLSFFDAIPYFPSTQLWGVWFISVLCKMAYNKPKQVNHSHG
ncbi:hypothetical protein CHISP_2040 [Chitinispirillum alkaliphilum]|nr:hypothetical protein CHISP_2040 [Chitinispirillum alkaliphilum]